MRISVQVTFVVLISSRNGSRVWFNDNKTLAHFPKRLSVGRVLFMEEVSIDSSIRRCELRFFQTAYVV